MKGVAGRHRASLIASDKEERAEEKRLIDEHEAVISSRSSKAESEAREGEEAVDHFMDLVMNMHGLYLLCALIFGGGIVYTMYFGLRIMGFSILDSVFLFAITVSTTGYNDMGAHSDHQRKWLLAYMWACVLVCGVGLGVIIAFIHENFEDNVDAAAGPSAEAAEAAEAAQYASRIVLTARARLRALNRKLVIEVAQMMMLYVTGFFVIMWCEGCDWLTGAVWATESLTTIGYGDFVPKTRAGRAFTIIYLVIGATMFARIIAFLSLYPGRCAELGERLKTMEAVGMRRGRRGPLARVGLVGPTGAYALAGAPANPGQISDETVEEIWEIRVLSLRRLQRTTSSRRLVQKSVEDKGCAPPDLSDGAPGGRMHRYEFMIHFLTMIKKIDANDILDASDFYNSLCENNPNAAEHGFTLEEARAATARFNRLSTLETRGVDAANLDGLCAPAADDAGGDGDPEAAQGYQGP